SRMLIHQASSGVQGTAADIEVEAREIIRLNTRIKQLLASDTGQRIERIERDINRDYWMSAVEAQEYGLIDTIVGSSQASLRAAAAQAAQDAADPTHHNANSTHKNPALKGPPPRVRRGGFSNGPPPLALGRVHSDPPLPVKRGGGAGGSGSIRPRRVDSAP